MSAQQSNRQGVRHRQSWPRTIEVTFQGARGLKSHVSAQLLDHSEHGVGVESPQPLSAGQAVSLRGLPRDVSSKAAIEARVVWCRRTPQSTYRIGLVVPDLLQNGSTSDSQPQSRHDEHTEPDFVDFYEVLQINANADPDTVHRVYRYLAQRFHPDNKDTGSESGFREILNAYRVLSDPEARAAYDAKRTPLVECRWRIFDQTETSLGIGDERRKRSGILSLLYAKRLREPQSPSLTVHEIEELLGVAREHLQTSLWFLREKQWIERTDNGRYSITIDGFEQAENDESWQVSERKLLTSSTG